MEQPDEISQPKPRSLPNTAMVCLTVAFLGYLILRLLEPHLAPESGGKRQDAATATRQEILQRDFKVLRLIARWKDDKIHVSGKLACLRGKWRAVTISFLFRGEHYAVHHEQNYRVRGISSRTPLAKRMMREFSFEIEKFDRPWEEHNIEAVIIDAVPMDE